MYLPTRSYLIQSVGINFKFLYDQQYLADYCFMMKNSDAEIIDWMGRSGAEKKVQVQSWNRYLPVLHKIGNCIK